MSIGTLNIGLIGAGRIGRLHAAHLASRVQGAKLLAVADISGEAARMCAEQYGIPLATEDYQGILDDSRIEAVVICSSTDTHARIIEEAAQAGKHIFCEKPIAHDLRAIDRALEAVERAGVKLQIGFNRRFDANYRRVRQAIMEGEIGQLSMLHITSRDPAPPPIEYIRSSGGLFLDMAIHDFDMARFLTGSEVETVYTEAEVLVDPEIGAAGDVDTAITVLRFANCAIGTIDNSRRAAYGYDQRVEVLGSKGAISIGNNYSNTAVVSDSASVRRDLPLYFFMERYTESFVAEMQAFVDAVLNDKPVSVTGQDGRKPVVMALAARMSYEQQRPVRLSEVDYEGRT